MNQTPTNEYPNVIAASILVSGQKFFNISQYSSPEKVNSFLILNTFTNACPELEDARPSSESVFDIRISERNNG